MSTTSDEYEDSVMATAQEQLDQANAQLAELRNKLTAARATQVPNLTAAIYRQPKIGLFKREDPATWFLQAEISLRNAGITVSATKADCIAEKLGTEELQSIKDLIQMTPRPNDLYERIKDRVIATFGSSSEARLSQLIQGEVSRLGKPSLILNRLRTLDSGCSDTVVHAVFLKLLPAPCRAMLSVSEKTDLRELADMADKYTEAVTVGETGSVSAIGARDTGNYDVKAAIELLTAKMESFETPITE